VLALLVSPWWWSLAGGLLSLAAVGVFDPVQRPPSVWRNYPVKSERVHRFQKATVDSAVKIMASMGVAHPDQLRPHMLPTRIGPHEVRTHDDL